MKFENLIKKAYEDNVTFDDAMTILNVTNSELFNLFAYSNRIREKYKGNNIKLCSIINAKSGKCSEDCAFCAQSSHYKTDIQKFSLVKSETIKQAAKEALKQNSHKFGIVTSGKGISDKKEVDRICSFINEISTKMHCCASLGLLDKNLAQALKNSGLKEYHHNLETAESFFHKICSTHKFSDNIGTIKIAKEVGLKVCSGGILGMGESKSQRVELAFTLKDLDVDSIPLNFLNPVKGTKLEDIIPIEPLDILKIIIMFRFVHPCKDIKVAGGRELNLRDLQSYIFYAGANSMMLGNYLTTKGRDYKDDLQMIKDLGLKYE